MGRASAASFCNCARREVASSGVRSTPFSNLASSAGSIRSLSLLSSPRSRVKSKVLTTREVPVALSRNARCVPSIPESSTAHAILLVLTLNRPRAASAFTAGTDRSRAGATARFSETWKMTACAGSPASSDAICAYSSTSAATIASTSPIAIWKMSSGVECSVPAGRGTPVPTAQSSNPAKVR